MTVLGADSCGRRGDSTLTGCVTSIWIHLGEHIFPLADLRTILHGIGLLYKEHISVVLRSLDDLWSRPPVLHVYSEALVGLRALRTLRVVVGRVGPRLVILGNVLVLGGGTICGPEATKA